jgi:ferredoxin
MNNTYFCEADQLNGFFSQLKQDFKVFLPAARNVADKEREYFWQPAVKETPFLYNAYRTAEPLKAFFTSPLEKIAAYFSAEKNIAPLEQKTVIFGVKSCDLAGHKVQDFVFLEGVEVDSLYRMRRENTIFISSDCAEFKKVCHCLAWDILPYPTEGYDLNLAPLNTGYLVEAGSKRAEGLIADYKDYFAAAKDTQISALKSKRQGFIERLKKHLLPQNLVAKEEVQQLVQRGYSLDTWQQFMLPCVECGGCNLICDTCHCFLLADCKEEGLNRKVRVWDSCLYANYARVAGGANPLNTRAKRLRNRFMKKFDFFVDNLKMPACCGCGRCIEVCPGKIDIREVLKDLAAKTK